MRSRTDSGMSLVETMIILGVLALLTSVVAPSIGDFVVDAKQTHVKSNLETLCAAVDSMLRDTGETFFLRDAHADSIKGINRQPANRVMMLVSAGRIPDQRDEIARLGSEVDWTSPQDNDAVQAFDDHLVVNQPGGEREAAYRTGGRFGWRGAYLGSHVPSDPWGRRFAANVEFLGRAAGSSQPDGNINSVAVLSAGPNGIVETKFASPGLERGGDDTACVIAGAP